MILTRPRGPFRQRDPRPESATESSAIQLSATSTFLTMSVIVEQYNSEWPNHFLHIKHKLLSHLHTIPLVAIEHVGSTSVPGLAAKPIIDVDIIVTRENLQNAIDALINKGGFTYLGELGIIDRHALRDPNQTPARNIYVCVDAAFQTRNHLAVRDTLRANSALRDEYAKAKLDLAARGTNIVDYTEAKSAILLKILTEAGLLDDEELAAINVANKKGERFGAMKTERLTLREFIMADVEAFHKLESRPEVVRFQTWEPLSREQAEKKVIANIQGSFTTPREFVELVVVHDEQFIGRVGAKVKRNSSDGKPMELAHADLWYSFMPESQGKGFATEAMKAFIPLLGSPLRLEIECDPRNTSSWKVAERLEFEKVSFTESVYECKGEWVDSLVYQKVI